MPASKYNLTVHVYCIQDEFHILQTSHRPKEAVHAWNSWSALEFLPSTPLEESSSQFRRALKSPSMTVVPVGRLKSVSPRSFSGPHVAVEAHIHSKNCTPVLPTCPMQQRIYPWGLFLNPPLRTGRINVAIWLATWMSRELTRQSLWFPARFAY